MIPVVDAILGIAKEGMALIPDPNKRAQMEADLEKARLDFEARSFVRFILVSLGHPVDLPTLDFGTMSTILLGMLGLGTMRTVEKVQGVTGGHG